MSGSLTFANLIAPVNPADFFADYWERAHLYVHRRESHRFDPLFSIADIDRWVLQTRTGNMNSITVTAREGAQKGTRYYRPRDVSIDKIYDFFANGHSIVINHLEDSWGPLTVLTDELSILFNAEIGVNAYLTPKGAQTFPIHTDDHDVLILQLYGEKLWHLHAFDLLPVMRLDYKEDLILTDSWDDRRLRTPALAELLVEPGDLVYIPRGMPHCAVAKDMASLHITVSINPLYWTDFLKAAVEQASVHAAALRRALRPGFITDPAAASAMREDFENALRALNESVDFDEVLAVVQRNRIRARGYPPDGHFASLAKLQDLDLTTSLAKRPGILCLLDFVNGTAVLRFGLRVIKAPARLRPALEFIYTHERFKAGEIPVLDDKGKLVLIRRLVREGLLHTMDA